MMTPEERLRLAPRRPSGMAVAASIGALWGAAGYLVLWGHLDIVVSRRFVVGPVGTLLLLPVRTVIRGIRLVEEHIARRTFDLSTNNAWIGFAAAAVGALIALVAYLLARVLVRRIRKPAVS